jgi:hypothetical protein
MLYVGNAYAFTKTPRVVENVNFFLIMKRKSVINKRILEEDKYLITTFPQVRLSSIPSIS